MQRIEVEDVVVLKIETKEAVVREMRDKDLQWESLFQR